MRSPTETIRTGAAALAAGLLAACGVTPVQDLVASRDATEVREIRRLPDCGKAGGPAAVEPLADEAALRAWQDGRGIDLIGNAVLPPGPYAVVDHGARDGSGYGLAVSRRAVQLGQTLRLTAVPDALAAVLPARLRPGSRPLPSDADHVVVRPAVSLVAH